MYKRRAVKRGQKEVAEEISRKKRIEDNYSMWRQRFQIVSKVSALWVYHHLLETHEERDGLEIPTGDLLQKVLLEVPFCLLLAEIPRPNASSAPREGEVKTTEENPMLTLSQRAQ